MSVLWIGEQRFAAGLQWQRGRLNGGAARRAARESGGVWAANLAGQTGFVDDAGGPGGTKPLAGALVALLRGRSRGEETWVAFVEEDGEDASARRVGVVRCIGGVLLADGDVVYANAQEAVEAAGADGPDGAVIVATPGLRDAFPDAVEVDGSGLCDAAAEVEVLTAVRTGGISRKQAGWIVACAVVGAVSVGVWAEWTAIGVRFGWIEEKQERPRVTVQMGTPRFLAVCRDEIGRRELGLAGFDRIAVSCHAQYEPDGSIGAPWMLTGRPVLEVRWRLRASLPPRVYVGLAEIRLESWFWAGVHDDGDAAGVVALPRVLGPATGATGQSHPEFRARIDGLLALRGFRIEYPKGTGAEVVLETERPLSEAVALVSGIEGLEVVSVAFEKGRWRFEGRRSRTQTMFEDELLKLTAPLARAAPVMDEAGPEGVA